MAHKIRDFQSDGPFRASRLRRQSIPTIKRLEAHDGALGGRHETGTKIRSALERAGIEFIDENGGGPGVRLRKRQKQ
jgi:hypothetical protein